MREGSSTVITGSLGGGKSLCGVDLGMEHVSKGGTLITNCEIYVDKVRQWMLDEFGLVMDDSRIVLLKQSSIRDFHNLAMRGSDEQTVMMLLDEAALDINSRDWKTLPQELFNFVILVRKLSIDLILIAQDANDLDKQLRQKMQREINCRSLKQMPILGGLVQFPIFIRVEYLLSIGNKPWRKGFKFLWKAKSWGMFNSKTLHGEKAQIFGALEQCKSEALSRVQYAAWPYYVAAVFTTLVASIITSYAS